MAESLLQDVNRFISPVQIPCGPPDQPFSYSYKIKELGDVTIGPVSFPGVIAGAMSALEIFAIAPGTGPGSPVHSGHAKRISMKFD